MGTTLQHGIFLPAEGERNCYAGLASNWTILDGVVGGYSSHAANLTIHVTAGDKEAWNGKADASALTAHTGNTTIHVTAEDKSKWDAVTSKANDTDVMHLTGDETSTGKKVFGDMATFRGSYLGSESSTSFRTCAEFLGRFDTKDKSGIFISKFRSNAAQGEMSGSDVSFITMDVLENGERTNAILRFNLSTWNGNTPGTFSLYPKAGMTSNLGITANKWTKINGLNPGSLSMPDLTAGVDISGYITNLSKGVNTYTPPANGWLSIRVKKTSLTHASLMIYQTGGLLSSCETTEFGISGTNLPVIANKNVEIYILADYLASATFYPCQGNI